jgi:hypothetical protein
MEVILELGNDKKKHEQRYSQRKRSIPNCSERRALKQSLTGVKAVRRGLRHSRDIDQFRIAQSDLVSRQVADGEVCLLERRYERTQLRVLSKTKSAANKGITTTEHSTAAPMPLHARSGIKCFAGTTSFHTSAKVSIA